VVVVPQKIRRYLNENNRFTLEIDSSEAVQEVHEEFARISNDVRLTYLGGLTEERGRSYFFLSDPAKNWWEITAGKGVVARSFDSIDSSTCAGTMKQ
jgi:hypothetical protein